VIVIILQISYDMVLSGILGMVLFIISSVITLRIIKLLTKKKPKKIWIFIETLILMFLCGYGISTYFALTDNATSIASITSLIYLFGAIFVIIVIYFSYNMMREQKRTEQLLMQSNTELEHVIEDRTKSLKDAQEKMMQQEKFAVIGKLAGSVAHELRNPLGIITNSIHFLSMKFPAMDDRLEKHLKIIREQSDRANKIISDLVDFARTRPYEMRMVDVMALIKDTLEQIPKIETIEIKTMFDPNLPAMLLDPGKMQQAFLNIAINAQQAMPEGGYLEVNAIKNDATIEIEFKDSGIGISSENLSKLFEPLFSTKTKGFGLGLVITKEIVEQHKGTIGVKSEVGIGTTFTIKLPVREKEIVVTKLTESFW
jgi:signal transduction histidine kinase